MCSSGGTGGQDDEGTQEGISEAAEKWDDGDSRDVAEIISIVEAEMHDCGDGGG